jgi:peptide-methionine (R)-S-oxide reductase
MTQRGWFSALAAFVAALGLVSSAPALAARKLPASVPAGGAVKTVHRTEADWKQRLTPQQFKVLRQKGTDLPFTGKLNDVKGKGIFLCAGCGLEVFRTENKFDSGTGWPSFWAPYAVSHVREEADASLGMERVELLCARCGGHLGHLFEDGPRPTGLRYCINSSSLSYVPNK